MKTIFATFTALSLIGCSGKDAATARPATGTEAIAEAKAASSLPPEKYVSTTAGFDLDLPGVWRGRYRAEEKSDITAGVRLRVDFKFVPDSGSKAPSFTLMTVRIFSKAAWEAAKKKPGEPIGSPLGETAKDVFVLSLASSNPYPTASAEAPVFDQLMISLSAGGQQVHLTPR